MPTKAPVAASASLTFNQTTLCQRLTSDDARLKHELASALRHLKHEIDHVTTALEDGARINARLITNAFPLAGMIARWNLLRDLLPCKEEP